MSPDDRPAERPRADRVALLGALPDLASALQPEARVWLAPRLIVPVITLGLGVWEWHEHPPPLFGVLVLEGLLANRVRLGGSFGADLVGPGHLLFPWATEPKVSQLVDVQEVRALTPTRLAVLDREFAAAVAREPRLAAAVSATTTAYASMVACFSAIRAQPHMEERVLMLLWHMAERWGRVTPQGVALDLPGVTQTDLAEVAAASRQSVSRALTTLGRLDLVTRGPGSTWLLHLRPQGARERLEADRRASRGRFGVGRAGGSS